MDTITANNTIALRQGEGIRQTVPADWKVALDAYVSQKDVRPQSRLTYRKALVQFFRWADANGRTLNSMVKDDIIAYKEHLLESGRTPETAKLYVIAVKGFYEWAEDEGYYRNIAYRVKPSGRSASERGFIKMHLTEEEGSRFLEHFRAAPVTVLKNGAPDPSSARENARNYAMANILIRTGIRTVEASRADVTDIRMEAGHCLLYVRGKGRDGKDAFVVLSESAYGPLAEYLAMRPSGAGEAPLFAAEGRSRRGGRLTPRTIQHIMKEGLRSIGLDSRRYSAHSLRHTTAVQILKHGGTQFDVQDVLRHASPKTSQIYLKSIERERRIERASETILDGCFKPAPEDRGNIA